MKTRRHDNIPARPDFSRAALALQRPAQRPFGWLESIGHIADALRMPPKVAKRKTPDAAPAQLWMTMLSPQWFTVHPEINAVIKGGPPLQHDRAKALATAIIAGLQDFLPKVEAIRNAMNAVEQLFNAMESASLVLAATDEVVLTCPTHFQTPNDELGYRVGRIARQIIIEREIVTKEDTLAITAEAYQRAREAMGERGSLVTMEAQDVMPIVFLRLRQVLDAMKEDWRTMHDRAKEHLDGYLNLSLFPRQAGGRPSLDLAMFLAWMLQDATTRGMTDERVAVFLQDAFGALPDEWAKLAPSVSTVARWRQEREKIPEIPHHNRPHKRR